ncbi:unnamed protein product [Gadus morhua 'NCC']
MIAPGYCWPWPPPRGRGLTHRGRTGHGQGSANHSAPESTHVSAVTSRAGRYRVCGGCPRGLPVLITASSVAPCNPTPRLHIWGTERTASPLGQAGSSDPRPYRPTAAVRSGLRPRAWRPGGRPRDKVIGRHQAPVASPHPNHKGRPCLKLKVYVRPPDGSGYDSPEPFLTDGGPGRGSLGASSLLAPLVLALLPWL